MAILGKNIDPNKKHYFSSVEENDLSFMADMALKEKLPVKIWAQGKDKEAEEYEVTSYEKDKKVLFLKSKSGGLMSLISNSKLIDKDIFIKVGKEKFQWFSVSNLKYNKESKLYYVQFNDEVYRSQQRSNYRLQASSTIVIQFKIGDDIFDGLDISCYDVQPIHFSGNIRCDGRKMSYFFLLDTFCRFCGIYIFHQFDIGKLPKIFLAL